MIEQAHLKVRSRPVVWEMATVMLVGRHFLSTEAPVEEMPFSG